MNKIKDNFNYFTKQHKDIYEAYANFGKAIHEQGGPLDDKTKALIKIAISATTHNEFSLETHIKKAAQVDCNRQEIEHAILLTAPTAGFPTMMRAMMVLRKHFDE